MPSHNWTEVQQLFHLAVNLPASDRGALLDLACAGAPEIRREVEALLTAHDGADSLLDQPPIPDFWAEPPAPSSDARASADVPPEDAGDGADDAPGERIPNYRLIRELGGGGMGVVYEAEQQEPVRRRVALKLIKSGMDTKELIARFDSERQALALMNHNHIATVYDGGATERGRPYFAMELVHGVPITE